MAPIDANGKSQNTTGLPDAPVTSSAATEPSSPPSTAPIGTEATPVTSASDPPRPAPSEGAGFAELFPGVRVDLRGRAVEFDGVVAIDAHNPEASHVFLELVACIPDTKEHESLVMTSVKPSHVHAALLLIGLTPGKPGGWDYVNEQLVPRHPTGDEVRVRIAFRDDAGVERSFEPQELITDTTGTRRFGSEPPAADQRPGQWVFAGSRVVTRRGREWYDADGAGMLIGLTTFGAETIAWSRVISPEAAINEPKWIADATRLPRAGTAARVVITPAAKR